MNCSHVEAVTTETVARSVRAPGGWGAEESGARSGSGPEATIHYFAIQLGACLAEMGPHCESLNESVIPPVKNAAPWRLRREISKFGRGLGPSKALAAAPVRRDHDATTKL